MSMWSLFIRSDKGKLFASLILKALKIFLGRVGEDLVRSAKDAVKEAELSGRDGTSKYKMAYESIKEDLRHTNIAEYFINLAIEAAVISIKEK